MNETPEPPENLSGAEFVKLESETKPDPTLAQLAYEGYCRHTGNKSLVTGVSLPTWKQLPAPIKSAWAASALAIKPCYCLGRRTIEEVAEKGQLETDRVNFVAASDLFHQNPFKLYDELILAVATVHEGESRHETAHRYICERELACVKGPVFSNPKQS